MCYCPGPIGDTRPTYGLSTYSHFRFQLTDQSKASDGGFEDVSLSEPATPNVAPTGEHSLLREQLASKNNECMALQAAQEDMTKVGTLRAFGERATTAAVLQHSDQSIHPLSVLISPTNIRPLPSFMSNSVPRRTARTAWRPS